MRDPFLQRHYNPAMKKFTHLGACLLLALGLTYGMSAQALTLGRLSVLSFLGQPLLAEIEIPEISSAEASSLQVTIAGVEAFKAAGLDYSPSVADLKIAGKYRASGRAVLELRGTQPITAPFIDLVLELTWSTGRLVRDYTILLDPSTATDQAKIPEPNLPMVSTTPSRSQDAAAVPNGISVIQGDLKGGAPANTAATSPTAPVAPVARKTAAAPVSGTNGVKIKRGDTAAAIAAANKPEGVSLDQMLIAMLRSNPQAFIDNNVNRLKAGGVLNMPTEEEASAITASVARQGIQVQARDFNDYRRQLAGNAPLSSDKDGSRNVSGKVSAKVQEAPSAAVAADNKLTLSKPTVTGKGDAAVEDKIAKDRASADAAARTSELNKNIAELNKLAGSASTSVSAADAAKGSKALQTPAPIQASAQAPAAGAPASATPAAAASAPVAGASAPAAAASAPAAAASGSAPVSARPPATPPKPVPPPPKSLLDDILSNPLTLPIAGVGGVILLLGLVVFIRRRRAKSGDSKATRSKESKFSATRQPPADTVFGSMGASEVNTVNDGSPASTMMAYSPSQLSTVTGDVDPIAEAEVYLAYNRDVQAEEILKEAKRNEPKRTDVQLKLLEIYVKRQDIDAFNSAAKELHQTTNGNGAAWDKVCSLASDIGSTLPLFKGASASDKISPSNQSSTPEAQQPEAGVINFDMTKLSLDLPKAVEPLNGDGTASEDAQLALAEEWLSIGDKAGARALVEEVIEKNDNPASVARARSMLQRLG